MTDGTLELYYNRFYPSDRKINPRDRVRTFRNPLGPLSGAGDTWCQQLMLGLVSGWGLWGAQAAIKVWVKVTPPTQTYSIDAGSCRRSFRRADVGYFRPSREAPDQRVHLAHDVSVVTARLPSAARRAG